MATHASWRTRGGDPRSMAVSLIPVWASAGDGRLARGAEVPALLAGQTGPWHEPPPTRQPEHSEVLVSIVSHS